MNKLGVKKSNASDLEKKLLSLADKKKALITARFFKTEPGDYAAHDIFLGITVPQLRKIAINFLDLSYSDLQKFLNSKYHEFRFIALLILLSKFKRASAREREKIFKFYLKNLKNINNWDLVDLSSYQIIGAYLFDKDRQLLYDLLASDHLWTKRVAIVSTLYFIKNNDLDDIYKMAKILTADQPDLIQKAVGWMLREAGKKDQARLEKFLIANKENLARTTWRYAIEKFSPKKKNYFMPL